MICSGTAAPHAAGVVVSCMFGRAADGRVELRHRLAAGIEDELWARDTMKLASAGWALHESSG
jgi:hypothetical protein